MRILKKSKTINNVFAMLINERRHPAALLRWPPFDLFYQHGYIHQRCLNKWVG